MNRRDSGYTLIEMLIVIALLSVMVILATLTLAILMRSERAGGDALVADTKTGEALGAGDPLPAFLRLLIALAVSVWFSASHSPAFQLANG